MTCHADGHCYSLVWVVQHSIVVYSGLFVLENFVGVGECSESLRVQFTVLDGLGHVWMVLLRQGAVGFDDLLLGGVTRDVEQVVAVLSAAVESVDQRVHANDAQRQTEQHAKHEPHGLSEVEEEDEKRLVYLQIIPVLWTARRRPSEHVSILRSSTRVPLHARTSCHRAEVDRECR